MSVEELFRYVCDECGEDCEPTCVDDLPPDWIYDESTGMHHCALCVVEANADDDQADGEGTK